LLARCDINAAVSSGGDVALASTGNVDIAALVSSGAG